MPDTPDTIALRGLRVLAHCGVLPEEVERRQPFSIDLEIETDLAEAGRSDDLAHTIDYGAIADAVVDLAESARFNLLERFATAIAETVLADSRVRATTVTIAKLRPPVPHDLAASEVCIRRTAS